MRSILIAIPTLNEARTIEGVLGALASELSIDTEARLVVVDGGSTDGTAERVKRMAADRPNVHLLHNPLRIQSCAVNLAARTFGRDADVLIRCDAHAIYPAGFVRALLETLDRVGADAVVVAMDSVGESCLQKAVAWVSDTAMGSGASAHRGGRRSGFVDHGHHAAIRMDSFRRAGGYDETFTHNEDAEFDCRQRALGARIYLDAGIRLGYRPRATWAGLWHQYFRYGRGRSRTARRHPGSLRLRQVAVPANLGLLMSAPVLAAWWPPALMWPVLYAALLVFTALRLAVRHRSACALLAAPAACVMHTAWALGFVSGIASMRERAWRREEAEQLWEDAVVRPST